MAKHSSQARSCHKASPAPANQAGHLANMGPRIFAHRKTPPKHSWNLASTKPARVLPLDVFHQASRRDFLQKSCAEKIKPTPKK